MTKTGTLKSRAVLFTIFLLIVTMLGTTALAVAAATNKVDHAECASKGEYCLVCDVAAKVNAIPDEENITIENAATVMQQINDIDRIKYDLSDEQYDEFEALVETSGYGQVTRYNNAVNKIKNLTGVRLVVTKQVVLGDKAITDLSEAEVSFEITNADTNATQTLTLFDLGAKTSAFGADFYTANSDGWTYTYLLPAGTYTIKEINQDKPITVNGNEHLFTCAEISDGTTTETGANAVDGMTVTLTAGSVASLAFTNTAATSAYLYASNSWGGDWGRLTNDDGQTYKSFATAVYINGTLPEGYTWVNDGMGTIMSADGSEKIVPVDIHDTRRQSYPVYLYEIGTEIYIVNGYDYTDYVKTVAGYALFAEFEKVVTIDASKLDTSEVTNLEYAFNLNRKMTTLKLGDKFTTSSVTEMEGMFRICESLTSLDLSNFDTSLVTNMHSMFESCKSITSLDLSGFDASNVTSMNYFLSYCSGLQELKLSYTLLEKFDDYNIDLTFKSPQGWLNTDSKVMCNSLSEMAALATDEDATYSFIRHTHNYVNGFCTCGYEPAELVNGVYQIKNGGNLFWFAEFVNAGNYGANAIITANEINLEGNNGRVFPGIGGRGTNVAYNGVFDGNNKSIKNLYLTESAKNDVGLFNYVDGATVKNFNLYGEIEITGKVSNVGAVIGTIRNSTVEGINSYVNITCGIESGSQTGNGTDGGTYYGGIVGLGTADLTVVIKKCAYYGTINTGSSVATTGGIIGHAGYSVPNSLIDCAFYGKIVNTRESSYIGAIVGYANSAGKIVFKNCLAAGSIEYNTTSANARVAVFGVHNSAISELTNCYYLKDLAACLVRSEGDANQNWGVTATAVTADQLKSGEVAWRLNGGSETDTVWKQTIGTAYPTFAGGTVYEIITGGCAEHVYTYGYSNTNVDVIDKHEYETGDGNNGFCDVCGGYQAPEIVDGYYQITNGGNLFWFAEQVNAGKTTINAKITANEIDLEGDQGRVWKPIGTGENLTYAGTFDGNGKTIKFGAQTITASGYGVFGYIGAANVKNITVKGEFTVDAICDGVAGVVGWVFGASATIDNCHSYVNITLTENATTAGETLNAQNAALKIAGIVAHVEIGAGKFARISNCSNYGNIIANGAIECVAGILAYGQNGSIVNCANYGNITSDTAKYVSGILGYVNWDNFDALQHCLNTGTISGNSYVGDIVGYLRKHTASSVYNNYYVGENAFGGVDTPSTNPQATKVTSTQLESGEVAWLLNNGNANPVWKQTIGASDYPTFAGETAYRYQDGGCTKDTFTYGYSNTDLADVTTHCANGYKYAATDNVSGQISVFCADCGEVLQTIEITLPEYLGYTGENKTVSYTVDTLVEGYDLGHNVTFAYLYSATEDGYFTTVDAVNAAGFYKALMTVGAQVATFAFGDAADTATVTSEVFEVTDTTVTFNYYDYNGNFIDSVTGIIPQNNSTVAPAQPTWTIPSNDYYTYTLKHWYCETDGKTYTTLPDFNQFYDAGIYEVDFKAVYNVKYNKEFHLEGSIDAQTGLSTSGIYASDKNVKIIDDANGSVTVYVNYAIKTNGGIASLLLIPEYDSRFTISAVSVNGENILGSDVASTERLSGWKTTVTGTETTADTFKILLEYLDANGAVNTATGELFIQIAYTMNSAVTGEYNFGFVTKYASDTYDTTTDSGRTHNDRSEAYGVVMDSPVASFNELKITVTDANIIIVKREDAEITMKDDSVVYDGAAAEIYEDSNVTDAITNVFIYHYSGCGTTLADGSTHDWTQYITIKWYSDATGGTEISAPTNVGTYYVGISAAQNDYYNAVTEQIFAVTITPYTIDVSAVKKNDKTYNGADQTWVESDFTISYVDGKQALNSETGYALDITNATHKNASTYTVTLTFTATGNYTFTENGVVANAGDTKVITLEVVMNKFALTITAENKTSQYSDALAALTYLLSATNNGEDATFASGDSDLTIALETAATSTSNVGNYNITITATSANDNYIFTIIHEQATNAPTANNGTYTITRKQITAPTIADLTYNGAEQFPAESEVAYDYTGESKKDAGNNYTLTATLVSNNYVWVDYVNTNNDNKLDRELGWKIVPATLTVTIGTVTEDYGKTEAQALATMLSNATATGLMSGDSLGDLIVLSFSTNGAPYIDAYNFVMPDASGYTIAGVASANSGNYTITINNGKYIVNPVVLGPELETIIANIKSKIKEYTGSEVTWAIDEFTLTSTLENGESIADVLEITAAVAKGTYDNANGKVGQDGAWTYYDPETKLYYTVTIKVIYERQSAYSFGSSVDEGTIYEQSVDVEVFIKQATNEWTVGPEVIVTDIEKFEANANAKFKAEGEVTIVLKDAEGNVVTADQLIAGKDYTATFTVLETNNYTGLETVLDVKLGYAYISLPTVYLDVENGTVVTPNGQVAITYDGVAHKFVIVPTGEGKYTITVNTGDDYASWKNAGGEYFITISLTDNYSWTGDDRADKTYTLVINKASLTITADDKTVTYRDDAPTYTTTENAFVNGETYATYKSDFAIADYISCTYVKDANAGTYNIVFIDGAESALEAILTNYDVTLEKGTLTVGKLELDLSGLNGQLDSEAEQTWANLVANGLTVEYNATTHSVTVTGYPVELVPTITYIQNEASATPKNAGTYTVKVVFDTADGYNANNFTWTDPSDVKLEITKVAITVTATQQTTAYTGTAIVVGALKTDGFMTWAYKGNATDFAFITGTDAFTLTGLSLNGTYSAVGTYENAIRVVYTFAEGVADNYTITYVDGTLTIEKEDLQWTITLETTDRVYNGSALKEGSADSAVDYFAKLGENAIRDYLTYKFYASNADDAIALNTVPVNAGTYYIVAIYDDGIHNEIATDYVEIVISKATVTISDVDNITKNYLQDYEVEPIATKPTLDTEDNYVPTVKVEYLSGTTVLGDKPLTVGTYTIKVTVDNLNDNYTAETVEKTLTINKATLSGVTFTYNLDTATWEAITTTTDGELINKYGDVTVTYKVGDEVITSNSFTATAAGIFTLVASVEGNENFANSESVMAEVFSVTFADDTENHAKNTTEIYDFSTIAPIQYRFSGQYATQPPCSNADAAEITIKGYKFAKTWELGSDAYGFTSGVTESITLHALWTIETYTVTWMNDDEQIYQETYEYLEVPTYTGETPTRGTTEEWIYTFSGWGTAIDGSVIEIPAITENVTYYAIYTKEGVTYTVTFMLSIDGGEYTEHLVKADAKFGDLLTELCSLDAVTWFRSDIWYEQEGRLTKVETVPVGGITVYGSYVFDIGNGDVNANGTVTADDITLYRQWIVGGYAMTVVEEGKEWDVVTAEDFNANAKYFLVRVADVNTDTSDDIRDITTVRMAIVKGYGYDIYAGVDSAANVTGEAVAIVVPEITYTIELDGTVTKVEGNTVTVEAKAVDDTMDTYCGFTVKASGLVAERIDEPMMSVNLVSMQILDKNNQVVYGNVNEDDFEQGKGFAALFGWDLDDNDEFIGSMQVQFMLDADEFENGEHTYTLRLTFKDVYGQRKTAAFTIILVKE